jgi:bifunctional UDP-N-acetylglucosamine pyrophosphorylase/glucosamine-1-phosphate N-acetyltransferase
MVVLGFIPADKKQYGILETRGKRVYKITEWRYWKEYPVKTQDALTICNSGIYAAKKQDLLQSLEILASRPHIVQKEINGTLIDVEEFFITDIVEYMCDEGLPVGYVTGEEAEVMGVDDPDALEKAQALFGAKVNKQD